MRFGELVAAAVAVHPEAERAGTAGGSAESETLVGRLERRSFHIVARIGQPEVVDVSVSAPRSRVADGAVIVVDVEGNLSRARVASGEGGGQLVVEGAVGIGMMTQAEEVGLERSKIGPGERSAAEQIGKGRIKMQQRRHVAAPVEGSSPLEIAQRLRHHGALHGVEGAVEHLGFVIGAVESGADAHDSVGIAEIPGESVAVGIDVAGRAGDGAVPRKPRVEEKSASFFHLGGHGVARADNELRRYRAAPGRDGGDRVGEFVEDV